MSTAADTVPLGTPTRMMFAVARFRASSLAIAASIEFCPGEATNGMNFVSLAISSVERVPAVEQSRLEDRRPGRELVLVSENVVVAKDVHTALSRTSAPKVPAIIILLSGSWKPIEEPGRAGRNRVRGFGAACGRTMRAAGCG